MLESIFVFAGGIGLLLLGMRQLSDGLKMAAGNTLRQLLEAATRHRTRAVLSGVMITTVVQSSSAVVFATIGFVNAGLLTLGQAIGIIFGSNLGTTLTSWLVALVGFNINLQAFAMPAIGVGMLAWVMLGTSRRAALGQALAGFGLFFLGIDVLKSAFDGISDPAMLASWTDYGFLSSLLFVFIGTLLTVLTQSSSAALAITLTAAAGGLVPFPAAAAMVIGANVGTTSTAALAVVGATSAAKRAAAAHVLFNVITALVALLLLPLLLWLISGLAELLGMAGQIAVALAILHTTINLLGLAIMLPATDWLEHQLQRRFLAPDEDLANPRFLDSNVLATPSLALDALVQELRRMGGMANTLFIESLSCEREATPVMHRTATALDSLADSVGEFAAAIYNVEAHADMLAAVPNGFRVAQHFNYVGARALELAGMASQLQTDSQEVTGLITSIKQAAIKVLEYSDSTVEGWSSEKLDSAHHEFQLLYEDTRRQLLRAAAQGQIRSRMLVNTLEYMSIIKRAAGDAVEAAGALYSLSHRELPAVEPVSPDASG